MKAAIICEGRSDAAVLTNLLKGVLDIDQSDVQYLVPELEYDETDLATMSKEQFSNWTIVKEHCEDGEKIQDFFFIDDDRFLLIHIDTDVYQEVGFDIRTPATIKTDKDLALLYNNVQDKLTEWLGDNYSDQIEFAIAMQEIDAWLMTIYDPQKKDTGLLLNPKERLKRALNKKLKPKERTKIFGLEGDKYQQYHELTKKHFRKAKEIKKLVIHNMSLAKFIEQLEKRL